MRSGGGKDKGSQFERLVGQQLSKWITGGERTNIFARNVLSGGSHTVAVKKGVEKPNIPGDLMAASPLAFKFLSLFSVECKHHKDLDIDVWMRDQKGTSFLSKTITHTAKQAKDYGLTWMVIAKQNMHPAIVIMPYDIGKDAYHNSTDYDRIHYHTMFNEAIFVMPLAELISCVLPGFFLDAVARTMEAKKPKPRRRLPVLRGV